MFWKANFYFIPYMFLNQIGGKQHESSKLETSKKSMNWRNEENDGLYLYFLPFGVLKFGMLL